MICPWGMTVGRSMPAKTVLVIEDEAQTRNIFLKCLEFEGFQAVGASDGTSGVALAQQHQPDLVVCDIIMPDMDGYETTRNIRQMYQFHSLPIIALTAKAMPGDREKCLQAGASDYIAKPIDIDQLLSLLRVWLYES